MLTARAFASLVCRDRAPGDRTRTPRRVKGLYKVLSTTSEDVGVAPTLLSGYRWVGEQSRLQPGSSPGLDVTSETCGKQCSGRLAFFAEMSWQFLGGIRCLGLPNDWKLRQLNLLGTPWVFPGNTHGATSLPPHKGFPSSLPKPFFDCKPQLVRPRPPCRSRSRVLLLLGNSCVLYRHRSA